MIHCNIWSERYKNANAAGNRKLIRAALCCRFSTRTPAQLCRQENPLIWIRYHSTPHRVLSSEKKSPVKRRAYCFPQIKILVWSTEKITDVGCKDQIIQLPVWKNSKAQQDQQATRSPALHSRTMSNPRNIPTISAFSGQIHFHAFFVKNQDFLK